MKWILALGLLVMVPCLYAAPEADLWPRWEKHDEQSTQSIDHSAWNTFLQQAVNTKHASKINLVSYAKVSKTQRQSLQHYIQSMEAIAISKYNRFEQRAYWINLYNAVTVETILEHYPVKSILDIKISPGWFSFGPWDAKLVKVEGKKLSLNDIEHRILRPIWKDNRVHYVVNCASRGCPNLAGVAYTVTNTESLLKEGAEAYVNHRRGVQFVDGELQLSKIYDWYQVDFGDHEKGVLQHLKQYAEPALRKKLEGYEGDIDYEYDWSLNE